MTRVDADVRSRLTWMWVFVLVNMVFADIFSFMSAGFLKQVLEGRADQITITPEFLLLAAVVTELPIAMIVLTQLLPWRVNRWANIVVSIATIAYIWGAGALTAPHYVFAAGVETVACLYIARLAWRWPEPDGRAPVRNPSAG